MTIRWGCAGLLVLALTTMVRGQWASPRGEVVFPDRAAVIVEIADTPELRERGLMFRERLAPNEGMVFIFEETGFHPFWMKNTLIPLDMIWVDEHRRIVSIAHSVPPCQADPCPNYSPRTDARYVVEVVSGFARQHNLKEGDQLVFKGIDRARSRR
jgi:uncharacterized membrane protein (UPF0127 family)